MRFELDSFHRNVPDDELIVDLQHVAAALGKNSVTTREYNADGKFHSTTLMERFGDWTMACSRAGLVMALSPRNPSEEDLFENLEEMWVRRGRQPKYRELRQLGSKYGAQTYLTRFGGWRNALEAFIAYIDQAKDASLDAPIEISRESKKTPSQGPRVANWRLRFLVMRRDNFKCRICGRSPATDPTVILDVDHIKAWSKGGLTILENLQTLCTICNIGKSDLEFIEPPNPSAKGATT
jgi:hypothetical protein